MFSKFIARLNKGSVLVPAVLLAVFVVFKAKFEQIFDAIAVKPLLAFVQSDWPTDAVFVLATLTAIIFFVKNLRESVWVAPEKLGYWLVTLLILLWYRVIQAPWIFVPFRTIELVTYADFVLLSIMLVVAMMLRTICRKKPENVPKGLIEGLPLGKGDVEKLGYSLYAKRLADRINESVFKNSFAIGITGEWGVGKTSFVNLVKRELNKSKTIVIDFNAWDSSSPKDITNDFFAVVSAKVSKHHTELSNLLISYAHQLTKTDIPIWSYYVKKLVGEEGFKSPAWYRDKISNILRRIKKRLVVCIDELDRLDKEELVEVIRLIRNTANLPNVVFLVTYDRNYVVNALKGTDRLRSEYFLEKIFQMEITLPRYTEEFIKSDLKQKLINALKNSIYENQIDKALNKNYPGEVSAFNYVKTLRDVNRLVNAVILDFDPLSGEIVFEDLLFLEILRIKYPSVFELLHKNKNDYLMPASQTNTIDRLILISRENGYAIIKFIEENGNELSIAKDETRSIESLLLKLFPKNDRSIYGNWLSICYQWSFDRYFSFRLFSNNLSEVKFTTALQGNGSDFNSFIIETVQSGLRNELVHRLSKGYKFNSKDEFEKIVSGIFLLCQIRFQNGPMGYNAADLAAKLSNQRGRLEHLYDGDLTKASAFVKQKFTYVEPPFYPVARLASELRGLMIKDEYVISKQDLDKIIGSYLQRHLGTIEKLDNTAWSLYQLCIVRDWQKGSGRDLFPIQIVIEGANDHFIKFVREHDLFGFLRVVTEILDQRIEEKTGPLHASVSHIVLNLFGSWAGFKAFLQSQKPESTEGFFSEFFEFFTEFENKGYAERIDFEFKNLFPEKY